MQRIFWIFHLLIISMRNANYFDEKSELVHPFKKTTPFSWSLSSSVLISGHKKGYRECKKSRTPNRFFCQKRASDVLPLIMSAKYEACTSDSTFLSRRSSQLLDSTAARSISAISPCKGLGIVDFMREKNLLITGATGFVAKVLIEKILRMQPDIGKLFLLIRAKDPDSALKRLKNEVVETELFRGLRERYGFEKFMLKKLVPVAGDMTEHNLGIEKEMADVLIQEVDIIASSAANTTFDERYDVALETNTKGVYRLFEFGKSCKKVQLFIHLSTAYVNGQRQGRALENPFQMGYSIAKEKAESTPPLDIQAEFRLANKALQSFEIEFSNFPNCKLNKGVDSQKKIAQRMKDLGIERARAFGWQDTYVFTKAMAEILMVSGRDDLPVVIVRPSVIESTYSQPFPGWIEGHRMLDPILTLYGKGQLSSFVADPDTLVDVVPVDMVVNATLAAIAKHAGKPGLKDYHAASSIANPIRFEDIMKIIFEHFRCNPFFDKKGKPIRLLKEMICFPTMEDFCDQALDAAENMPQRQKNIFLRSIEQCKHMASVYEPYLFYKGRFDISNLENLFQELSEEERESFGFDVKKVEWKNYLGNIHMHGLRQHVMKGRGAGKHLINIVCQSLFYPAEKNIGGTIPSSISRLSALTHLSLDNNNLTNSIPSAIASLPQLQSLSLSGNRLTGPIPESFGNLQSLTALYLDSNRLSTSIPSSIGKLSRLSVLRLNSNLLSDPIPDSFGALTSLSTLDISDNFLIGDIPSSFGNLSKLADLLASNNRLSGSIPKSLGLLGINLEKLCLDGNLLIGPIPESFQNLTSLYYLDLSQNKLIGNVPFFPNSSNLQTLLLSKNNLSGTIPAWLGSLPSLRWLHLSFNNFTGQMPSSFGETSRLESVFISNNKLTGTIHESFADMEYLEYLDLSNNDLTGTLPGSSGIYNLLFLNLSGNSLSGPLPEVDNIGLETLDLSYNNVSLEVILAWIAGSSFLVDLRLADCGISMRLDDWEPAAPSLYTSLDFSNNKITGEARNLFQTMKALKYVNLASNRLSGSIPLSIGKITSMEALDMSNNELNGTIPEEMSQLRNLKQLNVSYNHLCGKIPEGKPFNSFPASAFDHNDCLCGSPLPPCHSNSVVKDTSV